MVLLIAFSFLAGLVTILTPCIWPLLPIILSSTIAGGATSHRRPLGITLGIIISFSIFTLVISSLVSLFHIDPNVLRLIAVVVIAFLGLSMLIPALSEFLQNLISRLTGTIGQRFQTKGTGFLGGFITGLSLGIIWSPCAGPILASIATLAAAGKVSTEVIAITLSYAIGVGIPLFLFSFASQALINRTKFISSHTLQIERVFGILMLLTALAIYTNYDVYLQNQILQKFPGLNTALNGFENSSVVKQELNVLKGTSSQTPQVIDQNGLFNANQPAPDFTGGTTWLNSQPLTISSLKGKVVLVDFWTYTCINCIRTLPHVTSWYNTYKDKGFVVVGVHTPEFAFEHDTNNVKNALNLFGITYPVVQDNNYGIWNNYNNQYWPAEYLIDAKGIIRREHFGEGEYDQMEQAIQKLLIENGQHVSSSIQQMPDTTPQGQISPETYLGANRGQYYYPNGSLSTGTQNYVLSNNPPVNSFSLGGQWNITPDNAITGNNSILTYHFSANKVFLVLRPPARQASPGVAGGGQNTNPTVKVFLDNKIVNADVAGSDVQNGIVTIDSDRLYNLVDLKGNSGDHILRLEFQNSGIELYAFTFG